MFTDILVYRTSFYDLGKCVKTLFKVRLRYPAGSTLFFTGIFIGPAQRPETDYFFHRLTAKLAPFMNVSPEMLAQGLSPAR